MTATRDNRPTVEKRKAHTRDPEGDDDFGHRPLNRADYMERERPFHRFVGKGGDGA